MRVRVRFTLRNVGGDEAVKALAKMFLGSRRHCQLLALSQIQTRPSQQMLRLLSDASSAVLRHEAMRPHICQVEI